LFEWRGLRNGPPLAARPNLLYTNREDCFKSDAANGSLVGPRLFSLIVTVCLGLGVLVFFAHPWLPHAGVRKLDRFAREHLLENFEPVRNVESLFGGAASILFLACTGAVVAFYLAQSNVANAQAIVPLQNVGGGSAWTATKAVGVSVMANSSVRVDTIGGSGCHLSDKDKLVWTVEPVGDYACHYRSLYDGKPFAGDTADQHPTLHYLPWQFQHFDVTLFVANATRPECPFDAVHHSLRRGPGDKMVTGTRELHFVMLPHARQQLGSANKTVGFLSNFKAVVGGESVGNTHGRDFTQLVIVLERDIFALLETASYKLGPAQLAGVVFSAINTLYLFAIFIFKIVEKPGNRFFRQLSSNYPGVTDTAPIADNKGAAAGTFELGNPMHATPSNPAPGGATGTPNAQVQITTLLLQRLEALEARLGSGHKLTKMNDEGSGPYSKGKTSRSNQI
jgi:hypothetical protein